MIEVHKITHDVKKMVRDNLFSLSQNIKTQEYLPLPPIAPWYIQYKHKEELLY